jgi:hypothetical protein
MAELISEMLYYGQDFQKSNRTTTSSVGLIGEFLQQQQPEVHILTAVATDPYLKKIKFNLYRLYINNLSLALNVELL